MSALLEVKKLKISFGTYGGEVQAVRGVSLEVSEGEAVAVVGESGCGKTVTAQSILRLLPEPPARLKEGAIFWRGRDLLKVGEAEMQKIRGQEIGMIFQDPMTSLNPTMTVGRQLTEGLIKHLQLSKDEARLRAQEVLGLVGIPHPEERLGNYPHQFSGGMRQRVMIALALACQPKLIIADEPTTALDVTVQAGILSLLKDLRRRLGTAILLITHDLGVVAGLADRVVVMYAGKIVERGLVEDLFHAPRHPYTWGLLRSVPRLDQGERVPLSSIPGTPPDLFSPPPGCAFAPRCPHAMRICHARQPDEGVVAGRHAVACWLEHPLAPVVTRPVAALATERRAAAAAGQGGGGAS